jgi:hypothetical protein
MTRLLRTCLVVVKEAVYMFSFGDTCPGLLKRVCQAEDQITSLNQALKA